MGAVLGAFVGDSVGSYLEFVFGELSEAQIKNCMKMPGGGCHKVAPGQITDDSELALCLLRGIVKGKGVLDLCHVASNYAKWLSSTPFDVGGTCRNGLSKLTAVNPDPSKGWKAAAQNNGATSMSNGAMMRISPLAVFCSKLESIEDVQNAVRLDVTFTHAKPEMTQLCTAYCILIISLI